MYVFFLRQFVRLGQWAAAKLGPTTTIDPNSFYCTCPAGTFGPANGYPHGHQETCPRHAAFACLRHVGGR